MRFKVIVVAALFNLFTAGVEAGDKSKKSANREETTAAPALIRIWKEAFASKREIRVQLRPTAKKGTPIEMKLPANGYRLMGYFEIPAGDFIIDISEEYAKGSLFQKVASLGTKTFSTLLIRENANSVDGEVIDDTIVDGSVGELTIRNLAPTLTSLHVKIGDMIDAQLNTRASFLQARGLPKKMFLIEGSGTDESGNILKWSSEVDFRLVHRATLLIYPDPYGQIRPILATDGEMSEGETTPSPN